MIRSHFGLQRNPFDPEALTLLPHQQEIFDIPVSYTHLDVYKRQDLH